MSGRHAARAERALRRLAEVDPALAALSLWCRHREMDGTGPPAVSDHTTIHYAPPFDALSLAEQAGVAAHHILHIALRHAPRAEALRRRLGDGFDLETFNIGADALVNEVLVTAGHILPRPFVDLDAVLSAAGLGDAPGGVAQWDAETLYIRLMAAGARSGSGPSKLKAHAASRGFSEDIRPDDHIGDDGVEEREWQSRLSRALEAGRAAGRGIGAIAGGIGDVGESRVPWDVALRGMLARALIETPRLTYARPARRWIAAEAAARMQRGPTPAFEPGTQRRRHAPRVVVGLDVSTSIDRPRLSLFATQIAGIGRRTGAEVHVLVFDESVHSETRMQGVRWEAEIARLPLADGGGTDFRPVLARAAALEPSAIVVLTDLEGPTGEAPGHIPVIWAVPDATPKPPPFGQVLSLAH